MVAIKQFNELTDKRVRNGHTLLITADLFDSSLCTRSVFGCLFATKTSSNAGEQALRPHRRPISSSRRTCITATSSAGSVLPQVVQMPTCSGFLETLREGWSTCIRVMSCMAISRARMCWSRTKAVLCCAISVSQLDKDPELRLTRQTGLSQIRAGIARISVKLPPGTLRWNAPELLASENPLKTMAADGEQHLKVEITDADAMPSIRFCNHRLRGRSQLKILTLDFVSMLARRSTALISAYLTAVWTTFRSEQESCRASSTPTSAPWTAVFKPSSASVGTFMPKIDPNSVWWSSSFRPCLTRGRASGQAARIRVGLELRSAVQLQTSRFR